jgi:hypothetical protein
MTCETNYFVQDRIMQFTISFSCMSPTWCAKQTPRSVLCGYFVCQWFRTNRCYYNNPEDVSWSIKTFHMHMFINLNLIIFPSISYNIVRFRPLLKLTKMIFKELKIISTSSWCARWSTRMVASLMRVQSMWKTLSTRLFVLRPKGPSHHY